MSIKFTANHPSERDFRADDEGVVHVSMHVDVWRDDDWQAGFDLDLCPKPRREHGVEVWTEELQAACNRASWVLETPECCYALTNEVNRALTGTRAAYERAQQDFNMSK